jgi:protein SFI1
MRMDQGVFPGLLIDPIPSHQHKQTTNEQIAEARDLLVLRVAWQRWRARTANRHGFLSRIDDLSNGRCLKAAFHMWKAKLQAKQQAQWRDAMRHKLKVVRTKREGKLKKDAWAKWRQSYQSHLSGQHYTERLVLRFFVQWKRKLMEVDHMEATADELTGMHEERGLARCWKVWRRSAELRTTERLMVERVDLRVMSEVVHAWKRQMCAYLPLVSIT